MDRGFPNFELLSEMLSLGFQILVPLPVTGLFKELRAFLDKGRRDGILTIYPSTSLIRELKSRASQFLALSGCA
jgi:hypothetical protein